MLGGVAAGLGNYFKIDPVIVRIGFIVLTILTSGAFLLVYLAMWLLIPTPGSTATQPGQVVQENLNDMGARVRNFTGTNVGNGGNGGNGGNATPAAPTNGGTGNGAPNGAPNGGNTNMVPAQSGTYNRPGIGPIILIVLGLFFLFGNFGLFHLIIWHAWWPLFLIVIGVMLLARRNR
jgi:phage shock protein C